MDVSYETFQMCQNNRQDSHSGSRECASGEVENDDFSCHLSCKIPQLSTVSIMSECPQPGFVYLRRKQQGKSVTLSSAEASAIMKRSGEDCLSVISSDVPSVAVGELHVASQSEHANENPLIPSMVVNKDPAVFTSESINGCSHVKDLRSDTNSKYSSVYRRRKPQGRYTGDFSVEAPCLSVVSSDSPSDTVKELHVASQIHHTHLDPFVPSTVYKRRKRVSKSESIKGCFVVEEQDEASKSMKKTIEVDSIDESCSSSKSDPELVSASMQTEVDDSVECSSSSVMTAEFLEEDMSGKDQCISVLRSQGVLDEILPSRNYASDEGVGNSSVSSSSRLCKICSRPESTHKLLICDNCEKAFHLFCCNPRVKSIPIDEWFCHSCSNKRRKIHMDRCVSSIEKSNPIALMLQETEPYSSGVRYGKGFQAEVPEWSGPITNDREDIPEPLEMDPSDFISSTKLNLNKPSEFTSIGNWLQCREVIHGVGESAYETICGKWRRAPLFAVQTDKWDCFCSVRWDPVHADCAAPQELETDEVLKQLKYIQMLRPRLNAKRRKLERRKNDGDSIKALKKQEQKSVQQNQHGTNDSIEALKEQQQKSEQQNRRGTNDSIEEALKQQQQKPERKNQDGAIMYRRYTHGHAKASIRIQLSGI